MKKLLFMMSMLSLLSFGMTGCSSEDGQEIFNEATYEAYEGPKSVSVLSRGNVNVLEIKSDDGNSELYCLNPYCGTRAWPAFRQEDDGSTHQIYHIIFSAVIQNSSLFNVMQIDIESNDYLDCNTLEVGDTFDSSTVSFRAWHEEMAIGEVIRCQNSPMALGGQVQVVDKKTDDNGKLHITLNFQDLILDAWASCSLEGEYTFSGEIDFEVGENGIYPDNGFRIEEVLRPRFELMFFMMESLHSDEFQGRRTFFSGGPDEQECLIINSEEELREAYKGGKELPEMYINFEYCTLVIGRTYGEHSGVSLGGFELTDNGDAYQIDLTLNNNVNPNYAYTQAFTDLYFWKLYPKMEKKPVIFNRIKQDVNLNPFGKGSGYDLIHDRWILDSYGGVDSITNCWKNYPVGNGTDKKYTIEFKDNDRVEGRINDMNDFCCNYMIPYTAKREDYHDSVEHGFVRLWNVAASKVNDDDPLSERFMRVFDATQFQVTEIFLTLYVTPYEYYIFRRNGIRRLSVGCYVEE